MQRETLLEEIQRIPVIDAHSHLDRDQMAASHIDMLIGYHMLTYPFRSSGIPEELLYGGKRTEQREVFEKEWVKRWPAVAATGFGGMLRRIFRDLYEFDEPITESSFPRLVNAFESHQGNQEWGREILSKAGIVRVVSSRIEVSALPPGAEDPGIRFTIEATPGSGTHEYRPSAVRLADTEKAAGMEIASAADLRKGVAKYFHSFDWKDKEALVAWISSNADFTPMEDSDIDALLLRCKRGEKLTEKEIALLEGAHVRAYCDAIRGRASMFQIVYGIQFLSGSVPHPVVRSVPSFASTMGYLCAEYPDLHFNILNGCENDEPTLCSLCIAYDNFSLSNFWWHGFYRSVMTAGWRRRLEMVPASRLVGFFSDGWCAEWIYARLCIVREVLADVLHEKLRNGDCTEEQAVSLAWNILFHTPRRLFLPRESVETPAHASAAV